MEILFDGSLKKEILKMINMEVDEQGYIFDPSLNERVKAHDGSEITIDEFGGIKHGSIIFIKNDFVSLMELPR